MNMIYEVCQSCAIYLTNGDDSMIHPVDLPAVKRSVEAMGLVARADDARWGSFVCDCCGADKHELCATYEGMSAYDPPAPDSFWLKDLRNVLENEGHDDHDKIAIIREMMPDDPHTYTF